MLRAALTDGSTAVTEFVNADPIAMGLSAFRPESVAMAAGRVMLARMKTLARAREDFAFETTLASRSFAPFTVGLRNFFALYHGISDTWQVFDNSAAAGPRLIASGRAGQRAHVVDAEAWTSLLERKR